LILFASSQSRAALLFNSLSARLSDVTIDKVALLRGALRFASLSRRSFEYWQTVVEWLAALGSRLNSKERCCDSGEIMIRLD
jgi:hypothetical protein